MCGIAGSLSTREARPRDVESTLVAITQRMETRGPDAGGMWIAPGRTVALGHRRLSIIDPLAR
ncbi:MAG: hypothetical protein JO300_12435, partial [Silvibacterium sp.]|nr:hypothetical protein [Silvibacterium sp.]